MKTELECNGKYYQVIGRMNSIGILQQKLFRMDLK